MPFKTNPFLNQLGPDHPKGFDVVHRDTAVDALRRGRIRCTRDRVASEMCAVGDPEFLQRRTKQTMPERYLGMVSDYVPLSITPATRPAYAASTGYNTAAIPRSELVVISIDVDRLGRYGLRPLVTDRSPLAVGCIVSDDLQTLDGVPWEKVRSRHLRKNGDDSRGYDAEFLVWDAIPLVGVAELICPDSESRRLMQATAKECGIKIKTVEDGAAFF